MEKKKEKHEWLDDDKESERSAVSDGFFNFRQNNIK